MPPFQGKQTRVDTEADLGKIRHPLNEESLAKYLISQLPQDIEGPIELKQFGFGQSNPSYQIKDARNRKYVLRKQPPGKLISSTAHRVDREYYMLKSLGENTNVPVPRVLILCEDKEVIGTPFYIMDFVQGRIFHDPVLPGLPDKDRAELWEAAIDAVVALHAVDATKIGLPKSFLKSVSSHYPRQLTTLSKVEAAQAKVVVTSPESKLPAGQPVGSIPHFGEIVEWMKKNMPTDRAGVVHGDYKIDNLIFHPTENRVVAILDWELCTIGHPLADLGNLLTLFFLPTTDADQLGHIPTIDAIFDRYQSKAGWDPRPFWSFAVVYSHLRAAVITHGIAARHAVGQASSAQAAEYGNLFKLFADLAVNEMQNHSNATGTVSKL